jgi:hypothetical protein
MSQTRLLTVLGVLLVWAVIWFSMWLGGPARCDDSPSASIANTIHLAGCTRP